MTNILAQLSHARRILSWHNIRKGLRMIARGEFRALAGNLRNLRQQVEAVLPQTAAEDDPSIIRYAPPTYEADKPLVSIIIPCFNYGAHVAEAVASALGQTFRQIEVIVVDGGSTDGETPGVVAGLRDERLQIFLREGRHLAGSNRNYGIEHATGTYIVCLDADDILAPTFVEKALFLAEYCGADIVSTSLKMFGAKSGTVDIMRQPNLDDMVGGNHVHTCALFRRELWQDVGGFYDYGVGSEHVAEDWDFWIRAAASGARIINIAGEPLLDYRTHADGSLSSHGDVPSHEEQRRRILARLSGDLTPEAFVHSRAATTANRIVDRLETPLSLAMQQTAPAGQPAVLIVVPYFMVGGVERLLTRVVHELKLAGWRVVIVSTMHQPRDDTDSIDWFTGIADEVYALPRFIAPRYWKMFIDYLVASRRPVAVINGGSTLLYGMLPEIKAQWPALKAVDFLFNTVGHVESHARTRQNFDGVMCENEEVRAWYRQQGWADADIVLIESRIDVARYTPFRRPPELAEQFGIRPDDVVVGFSGRLAEEKSPETFVALARRCASDPNLVFVMTGSGPLRSRVEAKIARLPTGVRFHYCGVVDDVSAYFALYDICVIPSLIDGRPIAALEALASGCAMVVSTVGGLPRLVQDGENGILVPPGATDRFVAAVREIALDRARLTAMQHAARAIAERDLAVRDDVLPYADAVRRICARAD